jgi:hypothetical protein
MKTQLLEAGLHRFKRPPIMNENSNEMRKEEQERNPGAN